uniref:Unkown protein n=1 Tax=Riptortus pedestris TaxID=329032 RepID=R4WNL8_RIPPE|nr:unkown protein [Riptortus pedestris]
MKLVFLVVALIGVAVGEDAPYPPSGTRPQGPLLVLPSQALGRQYGLPQLQQPSDNPQVEASISLDRLSEVITQRLREQDGAQNGNYYVYLPDGRLQNVQYTAAPLKVSPSQNNQQVNVQNSQSFANSNTLQFNQQNAQANSKFQGYTQGGAPNEFDESRQALGQYRQPTSSGQYSQQQYAKQSESSGFNQQPVSGQYRQPAAEFNQAAASSQFGQQISKNAAKQPSTSGRYTQPSAKSQFAQQPLRSQYNEEAASNQYNEFASSSPIRQPARAQYPTSNEENKQAPSELEADQPEGTSDAETKQAGPATVQLANAQQETLQQQQVFQQQQVHYQQQVQVQEQWPATYVASVQFTDVQPIAAPIYSYAPAPLVRILRYAPKYE